MSEYTEDLRNVYMSLEANIKINEEKITSQHKIYTELYRVFLKHANKVATLANSINEEILGARTALTTQPTRRKSQFSTTRSSATASYDSPIAPAGSPSDSSHRY